MTLKQEGSCRCSPVDVSVCRDARCDRFESHAKLGIRGAMLDELRSHAPLVSARPSTEEVSPALWLKSTLRHVLGPVVWRTRQVGYALRFRMRVKALQSRFGDRVDPRGRVESSGNAAQVWKRAQALAAPGVFFREIPLASDPQRLGGGDYWKRFAHHYAAVGNGREKALEHALTFSLLDFSRVRRYCDVASSRSPITAAFAEGYPGVECWRQDLGFRTDLAQRVIGGPAQRMEGVPDGFFDAMALHCSFEHFWEKSDGEFVAEADRVLSERGACLIVPLYLDGEHRVHLDPTVIGDEQIASFDSEGKLCPTFDYRQDHGRYYAPETLASRVLSRLPPTLQATVLHFTGREAIDPSIYLRFGLVLHRKDSVFRAASLTGQKPKDQQGPSASF